MDAINEDAQKLAFASLLIEEGDAFKAGLKLFPSNVNRALRISMEWPSDTVVLDELKRIKLEVAKRGPVLPSKADLAKEVWARMQDADLDEDFVKLAKLYGDINGFIEKPGTTTNVNIQQNKVMTVRDFGTMQNWETEALAQQRRLQRGDFSDAT